MLPCSFQKNEGGRHFIRAILVAQSFLKPITELLIRQICAICTQGAKRQRHAKCTQAAPDQATVYLGHLQDQSNMASSRQHTQ